MKQLLYRGKRENNKNRNYFGKHQDGFTLVELLASLTIFSILLTISVVSILSWRDYADFKRVNEYAQSIYTAAQTQLTEYSVNGRLDELTGTLADAAEAGEDGVSILNLKNITTEDGTKASQEEVWNHSENSAVYAVVFIKDDYAAYKADANSVDSAKKAIFDMLDQYIYDKSILDATFSIELDPAEGLVYSILYSDKNRINGFEYNTGNEDESGLVDISDRTELYRRRRMVGYYGVDTLSKATSAKSQKPVISSLKLNNEDTLNLTWGLKKVPAAVAELTYEIMIYNDSDQPLAAISLNHLDETAIKDKTDGAVNSWDKDWTNILPAEENKDTLVGAKVSIYSYNEDGTQKGSTVFYDGFRAWIDTTGQVHVILDAVDLSATAESYLAATPISGSSLSTDQQYLLGTSSILGYISENQNIYCTLRGSANAYKNTSIKKSNTENMLYGSMDVSKPAAATLDGEEIQVVTYTYDIENARHLYNIRYEEAKEEKSTIHNKYQLTSDFAWSGDDSLLSNQAVFQLKQVVNPVTIEGNTSSPSFPQIKKLGLYSELVSDNLGGTHTIRGLILTYDASNYLVGEQSGTGLFLVNSGEISEVALEDVSVNGMGSVTLPDNTVQNAKATGSFCAFNSGKLSDLTVKSGTVTGKEYVGGVFGKMVQPSITTSMPKTRGIGDFFDWLSQSVKEWFNSLLQKIFGVKIEGETNQVVVEVRYDNLTNYAFVTGENYVGGICSEISSGMRKVVYGSEGTEPVVTTLSTKNEIQTAVGDSKKENVSYWITSVTLTDCENYGMVSGSGKCIGGIIGADSNLTPDVLETDIKDVKYLTISDCNSAPICNSMEDAWKVYETKIGEHYVYESRYVGGIVGYHTTGTLDGCKASAKTRGFIVGGSYVGGIVGVQTSEVDLKGTQEIAANSLGCFSTSTHVENNNNVIGNQYVGGIIGYNQGILQNCTNRGVVAGTSYEDLTQDKIIYGSYIGGISGYNSGTIDACVSNVTYGTQAQDIFAKTGQKADFVGGITGYNSGILKNGDKNENINVYAVVNGRNAVGGIIGYNDANENNHVDGYALMGGYVYGTLYVGGYIGYNTSTVVLQEKYLESNPNEVHGSYAVGGIIGANVINVRAKNGNSQDETVKTYFVSNNYLGSVQADGMAGGYIGYNQIYASNRENGNGQNSNGKNSISELIYEKMTETLMDNDYALESELDLDKKAERIYKAGNALEKLFQNGQGGVGSIFKEDQTGSLIITGKDETTGTVIKLKSVKAALYAGGVVGYNGGNAKLTLANIRNNTSVSGTGKVKNPLDGNGNIRHKTASEGDKYYSYAGGMIGYASRNTLITNCRNENEGMVTTAGTYTGGICEVNDGVVENCVASNIGTPTTDYVGGLVGLNEYSVKGCSLGEKTITGRNYVGGMVSENLGTIDDPNTNGTVTGYGTNIGGIAGMNAGKGKITISGEQTIRISGSGSRVGGLVGENRAQIVSSDTNNEIIISSSSSITGKTCVGGVIGAQIAESSLTMKQLINHGTITATAGSAGGIFGSVDRLNQTGTVTISQCKNDGRVTSNNGVSSDTGSTANTAENSGTAGILPVAESYTTILNCKNQGTITSARGAAGGITAVNKGTITNCNVSGAGNSTTTYLITGYLSTGGISGVNEKDAVILDAKAENLKITNDIRSQNAVAGGITGTNNGTINWTSAKSAIVTNVTVSAIGAGANIGGITGWNEKDGKIIPADGIASDIASNVLISGLNLAFNGMNSYGSFGGVAGSNDGVIANCSVTGDIEGGLGATDYGYGGIAGVAGAASGSQAVIRDCTFDGKVYGNGNAAAVANIGGIVGKNYQNSTITGSILGITVRSLNGTEIPTEIVSGTSNSAFAYIGGIAGWNYGTITDCDNHQYSKAKVNITGYAGDIGGIVGNESEGAVVTGSKDEDGKRISTGATWKITANYYSNDAGTGGIIGYSASGKNITYAYNHAEVLNTVAKNQTSANNVAVGGIVGRLEENSNADYRIQNCSNYGKISAGSIAGGILGRTKYQGLTVENCDNYGTVGGNGTSGPDIVSGIVASGYMIASNNQNINIISCGNYGNITGSGGALFGTYTNEGGASCTIRITDSINTGVISSGVSGICGSGSSVYLIRCRNYGLGSDIGLAKMTLSGESNRDNFVFSDANTPFDSGGGISKTASNIGGNYYVKKTDSSIAASTGGTDDGVQILSAAVSSNGTVDTKNPLVLSVDADANTRSTVFVAENTVISKDNPVVLTYSFTKETSVNGLGVQWFGNGTSTVARRYVYNMYYLNASNEWVEVTGTDTNTDFASADSLGATRNTYVSNAYTDAAGNPHGAFVEVGIGTDGTTASTKEIEFSTYYHKASSSITAKAIKLEIIDVKTLNVSSTIAEAITTASKENGWTATDAYKTGSGSQWNSDVRYVTIRSILAANTATVSMDNTPYATSNSIFALNSVVKSDGKFMLSALTGAASDQIKTTVVDDLLTDPMGSDKDAISFYNDKSEYQDYKNIELGKLSYRYKLIKEIEERIQNYYKDRYTVTDTDSIQIKNLKYEDIGGAYKLLWDVNNAAQVYDYLITYKVVDTNGNTIAGPITQTNTNNKAWINIEPEWYGKKMICTVQSEYYSTDGALTQTPVTESSTITIDSILKSLAQPQVHLEMVDTSDGALKYQVILDNSKDYEGDTVNIKVTLSGENEVSFSTSDGKSGLYAIKSGTADNRTLSAQAESVNGTCGNSMTVKQQTFAIPPSILSAKDYAKTAFAGFYGATPEELYYQLSMEGLKVDNKSVEAYYLTELLYMDSELGIPVAAGSGESHVTGQQVVSASVEELPSNLLTAEDGNTILVRSYPWKTQNNVIYYGHIVGTYTKTQIEAAIKDGSIVDTDRNNQKVIGIVDGKATVSNGYVVTLQSDGTYQIRYSSILAKQNSDLLSMENQVDQKKYTLITEDGNKKLESDTGEKLTIENQPVINEDTVYATVDGKNGYQFTWDGTSSEKYQVTLYGLVKDGSGNIVSRVTLGTQEITGTNAFFTDAEWNYADIELVVVKEGTVDATGKTTEFGAEGEENFNIKLRMATIATPTVVIADDNSLIYEVSWPAASEAELAALDHYEVSVDGTVLTTETLPKIFSTETPNQSATTLRIDLNNFKGDTTAQISVKAIAKTDSTIYRDSADGDVRTIEIASRLSAPDMTGLTISKTYGADTSVSVQEFLENGLIIKSSDTNNGKYQMVMEIYDEKLTDEQMSATDKKTPIATFGTKEEPLTFTGESLSEGTYNFAGLSDFSIDYAGKYLCIVIRSTSSNHISSVWTNETDGAVETVKSYAWIQLPRVKLAQVASTGTSVTKPAKLSYDDDYKGSTKDVAQQAVTFTEQDHVNEYAISIGRNYKAVDESTTNQNRKDASYLRIYKNVASGYWEIYYASTDDSEKSTSINYDGTKYSGVGYYETTEHLHLEYGTFIGIAPIHCETEYELVLPYSNTWKEYTTDSKEWTRYGLQLASYLQVKQDANGKDVFTMILPNAGKVQISDTTNAAVTDTNFTQTVLVQAIAGEPETVAAESGIAVMSETPEKTANYDSPDYENWNQISGDGGTTSFTRTVLANLGAAEELGFVYDKAGDAVKFTETATDAATGEKSGYYSIKAITSGGVDTTKYWTQFQIAVLTDDKAAISEVFYVPGSCENKSNQFGTELRIPKKYAGKTIQIRSQSMLPNTNISNADITNVEIFSEWSIGYQEVTLQELSETSAVSLLSLFSIEDTEESDETVEDTENVASTENNGESNKTEGLSDFKAEDPIEGLPEPETTTEE